MDNWECSVFIFINNTNNNYICINAMNLVIYQSKKHFHLHSVWIKLKNTFLLFPRASINMASYNEYGGIEEHCSFKSHRRYYYIDFVISNGKLSARIHEEKMFFSDMHSACHKLYIGCLRQRENNEKNQIERNGIFV